MDRVEKIVMAVLVAVIVPVVGMLTLALWFLGKTLGAW